MRFGLRGLLAVLTVACIWLAVVFNQCRRQRRAVEAIEKAGGQVIFDYQQRKQDLDKPPPGPPWLRRLVGDELFREPVHVVIRGEAIDDALLAEHLPGVSSAHVFGVDGAKVTDASMPRIAELPRVDILGITSPRITDAGLASLRRMAEVETLFLACPSVTDAGMEHIAALAGLETLTVNCVGITPDGIRRLKPLSNVRDFTSMRDERNREVILVLRSRAMNEFTNVPVADALEFFGAQFGVAVKANTLTKESREREFTFADKTKTNEDLLEQMLEPAGLGFAPHNGELVITSKEEAAARRAGYRAACETFPQAERIEVDW